MVVSLRLGLGRGSGLASTDSEGTQPALEEPERVTGRKARGLQTEEIGFKCQTFFISLLSS